MTKMLMIVIVMVVVPWYHGDSDNDIYHDEVSVCVFVCLSRKIITFPFRTERWRRKARRPLGQRWRLSMPSLPVAVKIFASGVNFSIFTHFLSVFSLKLLKLGEIDSVKFLA